MSTIINLSELSGETVFKRLQHYLETQADLEKKVSLITPETLPAERQRGETCKLKALADAMAHTASLFKSSRLPLYKSQNFSLSLRELAKRQGSVVGEVYSIEMLRKTCFDAGYESKIYDPGNEDDYIKQLERLIDVNYAPIVFYDVDMSEARNGLPSISDGTNEHACVVVGYYKDHSDETHFIITQWGYYYDFNGMELALSACYSLADKREIETFDKYYTPNSPTTKWCRADTRPPEDFFKMGVPSRTSLPMKDTDTPLKGKIMVVTEPRGHYNPYQAMSLFAPKEHKELYENIREFKPLMR